MKLDKRQVICVSFGDNSGAGRYLCGKTGHSPDKREWARKEYIWSGRNTAGDSRGRLLAKKVPLAVRIGERRYTKEQAADAIHMAAEELSAQNCRR